MNKHFIKVTQEYSCKNQLQKLILERLKKIDHTLCGSQGTAVKLIQDEYKLAVESYTGKAALPSLKSFQHEDQTAVYYVEDVIYLHIYQVLQEKNVNKF